MRQLQRDFEVETRFGGGFVQEIDGVGGGRRSGRPVDWFYYVNGIEADSGAASRKLAARRPRVVGPPRLGRRDADPGGRRLVPGAVPVRARRASGSRCGSTARRTRCASAARCASGSRRRARGSAASARSAPAPGRACCGCWSARGPRSASTRPRGGSRRGRRCRACSRGRWARASEFELLDPRGERVRTLGAGSGLVAATRYLDQDPTWVVTGTDRVGVAAAAAALVEDAAGGSLRGGARERARGAAAAAGGRSDDAVTYRRRSSPLHAARAGVGSLYCVVLAGGRAVVRAPAAARRGAGRGARGGRGRAGRRRGRALAAVGAAVRAADRGRQRVRGARGADRDRAVRGAAAAGPGRRDARGDRLRRHPRPARAHRDRVLRAALGRGRPGRAAAAVPAVLVPLGADRRAGDADGPGARARRPADARRPALPAGPPGLARRRSRGR